MPCEHRIAAGGLVIEGGKILLVRYLLTPPNNGMHPAASQL